MPLPGSFAETGGRGQRKGSHEAVSERRKKPQSVWRRLTVGAVVLIAIALITIGYKQYSAEKLLREPVASRAAPPQPQEKLNTKPKPAANVADRPSRERGPRP